MKANKCLFVFGIGINNFLIVKNETSEIPIYDNIADPKANGAQDTIHYQEILRVLSIPVPEGFWEAMEVDRLNDVGNVCKQWDSP